MNPRQDIRGETSRAKSNLFGSNERKEKSITGISDPEIQKQISIQRNEVSPAAMQAKSTNNDRARGEGLKALESLIKERELLYQMVFAENVVVERVEAAKSRFKEVVLASYETVERLLSISDPRLAPQKERAVREIELADHVFESLDRDFTPDVDLSRLLRLRTSLLRGLDRYQGSHPAYFEAPQSTQIFATESLFMKARDQPDKKTIQPFFGNTHTFQKIESSPALPITLTSPNQASDTLQNRPLNFPLNESLNQPLNQLLNESLNPSSNQPTNLPIIQPPSKSPNQPSSSSLPNNQIGNRFVDIILPISHRNSISVSETPRSSKVTRSNAQLSFVPRPPTNFNLEALPPTEIFSAFKSKPPSPKKEISQSGKVQQPPTNICRSQNSSFVSRNKRYYDIDDETFSASNSLLSSFNPKLENFSSKFLEKSPSLINNFNWINTFEELNRKKATNEAEKTLREFRRKSENYEQLKKEFQSEIGRFGLKLGQNLSKFEDEYGISKDQLFKPKQVKSIEKFSLY